MKTCIWCQRTEDYVTFDRQAHTLPQSLGGENICKDVCDSCNSYFGSPQQAKPAVEVILKEALAITKFRLIRAGETIKKGSSIGRYTSTYFKVDFNRVPHTIRIKAAYNFRPHFQETITRQFKRGIYKVFLEESQRQRNSAMQERFNFIRQFARYDLNDDLPVLHFERKYGAILTAKESLIKPELSIDPIDRSDYLVEDFGYFEFEILGHVFGIATSQLWELNFNDYIKKSMAAKDGLFDGYRHIKVFDDIDLAMSRTFDNDRDKKNLGN